MMLFIWFGMRNKAMKKYECIKGLVFGDREIPPVKLGTNWVETYDKRPDNYVHLEQNGNPGDWLEMPEEAMKKYFREVEE